MCTFRAMRALIVIPLALGLAGCAASADKQADTTPKKTAATKASAPAGPTYPGKKKHDVAVQPGAAVELSGWTTTAGPLKKVTDPGFGKQVCTAVTLTNRDKKSQTYSIIGWKLQGPGGDVKDTAISASNNAYGNGELAPGGKKTASICFDDPGQHGATIVFWQPDLFSSDARGAWVNKL